MKKSVRMADIAQALGISTVSVSKALAGKPGVSEEMRTKVIAVAHQMGYDGVRVKYEPGLTGNIGVLISDSLFSENTFYADLYRELVLRSRAEGFTCIIEIVSREAEEAAAPPPLVEKQRVDGIIFMGDIGLPYLKAVAAVGLPCLTLDFRIPGLRMDSIIRDNEEGGFLLTKHLLACGYKKIGFTDIPHSSANSTARWFGYQWAMRQAGLVPREEWTWIDNRTGPEVYPFSGEPPEAFVCATNEAAFHMVQACRRDLSDIALVCFDDYRVSARLAPSMTIYQVDAKQMAETAIAQLACRIRGEHHPVACCVIPGQIITD